MKKLIALLFLASSAHAAVSINGAATFVSTITITGAAPILSTSTLQSGTTFFVSSGAISGVLTVTVSTAPTRGGNTFNGQNLSLTHTGSGKTSGTISAMKNTVKTSGVGSPNTAYGIQQSFVDSSTSTVGSFTGYSSFPSVNGGGIVAQLYGFQCITPIITNSSVIQNLYGMYISNPATATGGSITTNYGIYIEAQNSGSTNYAIESLGGLNDFQGGVTLGSFIQLFPRTSAQISAITPTSSFQYYGCSDCATVTTCVSTGTTVGAFALITNKTAACQ